MQWHLQVEFSPRVKRVQLKKKKGDWISLQGEKLPVMKESRLDSGQEGVLSWRYRAWCQASRLIADTRNSIDSPFSYTIASNFLFDDEIGHQGNHFPSTDTLSTKESKLKIVIRIRADKAGRISNLRGTTGAPQE